MKAINITILFDGHAEAAFNLYRSVFGGEFSNVQRMKDMPDAPPMSAEEAEKILFMSLPVAGGVLMGMDCPPHAPALNQGNNFMVTLDTESKEETTRLFNGLSANGTVLLPLGDQFWGAFFGMVKDEFGIQWMLSYVE